MLNRYILQRGVTLIELMIAMVISSILLLGVGSIYSNSKRTYVVQEEFARLQESARFAMKYLVEDIRMAGFIGCATNDNTSSYENRLNSTDDFIGKFRVGLEGYEANTTGPGDAFSLAAPIAGWNIAPPAVIAGNLDGSDILIVRYAADNGIQLEENKDGANFTIFDQSQPLTTTGGINCHPISDICEGDILLATDCEKSRLFQASKLQQNPGVIRIVHDGSGTPGNIAPVSWGNAADKDNHYKAEDTQIFQASAFAYFVGTGTSGEPALFRVSARPGSGAEELVEGVENMQILYGIDTNKVAATDEGDGIANRYVPANLVNFDLDNVVSARISLLVRTTRDIPRKSAATTDTYMMAGVNPASATTVTTAADNRLRKVFTTTIKVRNKGL